MMTILEHFIYRRKIVTSSGAFSKCRTILKDPHVWFSKNHQCLFEMQLKADKMYWNNHKVNWRSWIWTYSARAWHLVKVVSIFLYSFFWQSLYLIEISNFGSLPRKQWYYLNSLTSLTRIYTYDWHINVIRSTDKYCSRKRKSITNRIMPN